MQVRVALDVDRIPLLDGAAECAAAGVASSLAPQNSRVAAWIADAKSAARHPKWLLLLDPQTGALPQPIESKYLNTRALRLQGTLPHLKLDTGNIFL